MVWLPTYYYSSNHLFYPILMLSYPLFFSLFFVNTLRHQNVAKIRLMLQTLVALTVSSFLCYMYQLFSLDATIAEAPRAYSLWSTHRKKKLVQHRATLRGLPGQQEFEQWVSLLAILWSILSKGPFKYYVIKEVGGWGQKMAIFDDLQYCKSSKKWMGGSKKVKNMMT